MMKIRKRYTPQEKVKILREHLDENRSVAEICKTYRIHPNQFYRWKKELFEKAPELFTSQKDHRQAEKKLETLEKQLADRNEIIAELLQENLKLKKVNGEI
ncbi:MAG: transposase [candidate division KSB1 bacterium]|nr:transposase [candidate division KSB1 bacterium]